MARAKKEDKKAVAGQVGRVSTTETLPELDENLTPGQQVEIDAATRQHLIEINELGKIVVKALGDDETNGVKPNGKLDEQAATEPAKKPAMLTGEAEMVRKSYLSNAHDAVRKIESGKFDADAMKAARKHLRRVKLIAVFPVIEAAFAGRPENSVTAEEIQQHIESALAALPPETGDDKFAKDANKFVGSRYEDVQRMLHDLFNGRYNVSLDEVLVKEAEIVLGRDPRRFYGLKVDGDPMNCNFRLNIGKADELECAIRLIPLAWRDHGTWTGHFLIRQTSDGNQKIVYCGRHAGAARKDGAQMLSSRDADKALDAFKRREKELEATRANLGSIAKVKVVDGRIVTEGRQSRSNDQHGQRQRVSDAEKRAASTSIEDFLGRVPGPYFFKHRSWEIRVPEGTYVSNDRPMTGAEVFIESDGEEAVVLDRKNDFGKMVGVKFALDDIPGRLWAFLSQVRNLNQTD